MGETVIVGGARTAFGKLGGVFRNVRAVELGAAAISGALNKLDIDRTQIDEVIMGMVLQAGAGQNPSRQAVRLAGLEWSIPSETINKVCASGLRAITLADQMIRAGDAGIIAAGGMESMSSAPYGLPAARWGARMGDSELTDLMVQDGLHCAFGDVRMAVYGNQLAAQYGISRAEQDDWALRSHAYALTAIHNGQLAEEIIPYRAASGIIATDEGPREDTSAEKLAKLPPIVGSNGTVTAGNAPGVNDGAAALLLMSAEAAAKGGHKPLARIIGHAAIGLEASQLGAAPAVAIQKLMKQTGVALEAIDLFEVNEAFASVIVACGRTLGWDANKVNVNGGAIALGHPIGASGARIVLTLIHHLLRRGGGIGAAAICSGGAQGDAILIKVDG